MPINSRAKGKRGELEARDYLRSLGFTGAFRTQQFCGKGTSDVTVPELPGVHIEVKYGYPISSFDLCTQKHIDACQQASDDAGNGREWVVLWKPYRYKTWRLSYQGEYGINTLSHDYAIKAALLGLNGGAGE